MKVWFPVSLQESKKDSESSYYMHCSLYLARFKAILRRNVLIPKWNVVGDKLIESELLHNVTQNFKVLNIPNQFINNLRCTYDGYSEKCYYYIPDIVRCFGTTDNLNKIIHICEFGNDMIPPLNWVRHSYLILKDTVRGELKS